MVNIKGTTDEFLVKLYDGRVIDAEGWNDWEWTHGIGLNGIWTYYDLTGDSKWLKIIEDWFAARFAAGGTTKNINTIIRTNNPKYLPWLDSRVEWAYHDLERTRFGGMQHITYIEENGNYGNDTLMMTVLPLATIGKVSTVLIILRHLLDTNTGLFFHDFYFKDDGHNFAREHFWIVETRGWRWPFRNFWTSYRSHPGIPLLHTSSTRSAHHLLVSEESTARTRFLDDASAIFPLILSTCLSPLIFPAYLVDPLGQRPLGGKHACASRPKDKVGHCEIWAFAVTDLDALHADVVASRRDRGEHVYDWEQADVVRFLKKP
ncbi:Six-hairpin glycosidase-like protein [Emericellopsis atlantica]|uniref:Six-hairpin glycosidase-like protein n=1 Tax=Emericellopsis atlantica TaxID=2614577 RepID=A0A9P8CRT9_9HYPO|nr:Six-hairpin glycosidase-like protein [Emericellopsis atlantica]KAG9257143.1 Six-hairpin glycosidase-like protein [Emericellopsis atlantica]